MQRKCKVAGCGRVFLARDLCGMHYQRLVKHGSVVERPRRVVGTEERFWSKVRKTKDCWVWVGSVDRKGYGRISINAKPFLVHRLSWIIHHGTIIGGLCVLHRCDNPPCINPAHLFLGSVADNNRDMAAKERASNQNKRKTHCKNGHRLSGKNLYVWSGHRHCVTCGRANLQALRARRKNRTKEEMAA